jgi:hypothetical protein
VQSERRFRRLALAGIVVVLVVLAIWAVSRPLSRFVSDRVVMALKDRFGSDLEVRDLHVKLFPRIRVTGEGLVFRVKGQSDKLPLIAIGKLSASASIVGLLHEHLGSVRLDGLRIHVPPRQQHRRSEAKPAAGKKAGFVIDEIDADGTILTIMPKDAGKEPLVFDIGRLRLRGAGPNDSMSFRTTLINAKPPGEIQSDGNFGPWDREDPGATPVSGTYTFEHADLSVFKGIAGKLSSKGGYHGVLDRIEVEGSTDTPDFVVKASGNPVHLITEFKAIVDGMNGNTLLQPVNAHFGHSFVAATGGVEGRPGVKGKTVSLGVTVKDGRLEDMLLLGVHAKRPPMTGTISFHTKLVIPPGGAQIAKKLKLEGGFQAVDARFSQLNIQEKVDMLSHRGRGDPHDSRSGAVLSDFQGRFDLNRGIIAFESLSFRVPGVTVSLHGNYGLLDQSLDFHGTARLEAKLSQTTTGFKSFLLKAINRFFEKKNAGAVIPIKIQGTRDKPSFGLDTHKKK